MASTYRMSHVMETTLRNSEVDDELSDSDIGESEVESGVNLDGEKMGEPDNEYEYNPVWSKTIQSLQIFLFTRENKLLVDKSGENKQLIDLS